MKILNSIKELKLNQFILRLLTGFSVSVIFCLIVSGVPFYESNFFDKLSFSVFLICITALFVFFCFIKNDKTVFTVFFICVLFFCILTSIQANNFMFSFGMCLIMFISIRYFNISVKIPEINKKQKWLIISLLVLFYTLFVGGICCIYYKTYRTPCYDFGLFSQMFYYMKETGKCLITCERDALLNHFAVHFSPVYYLLLPIYLIFPSPCTLLILQAFIVSSAVIPLALLCEHFGLSNRSSVAFSLCLLLYPAFMGGCFWYLHENCFLTPFILWLMYFFEKGKAFPIILFSLLTLCVKEDAAIYVAVISLYYIFAKKNYKCSLTIFVFSIVYFVIVTKCMSIYGEGIMSSNRYGNYIYDDNGIFTVVKSVMQNPAYAISQVFTSEKLVFLLQLTVGLSFLPFAIKKPENLILLIPLLVVNLMTDYKYQFNIGFQYVFGSGALLFYMAISNYSSLKKNKGRFLIIAVLCSVVIFSGGYLTKAKELFPTESRTKEVKTIEQAISLIPDNAPLCASTFLLANVSERPELYELESTSQLTEYILADLRYNNRITVSDYLREGYELLFYEENIVAVLRFE